MSNTQYAFLTTSRVPTRVELQASIDSLGFDLKLHPELDLRSDTGFSPCILAGVEDVGFELFGQPSADVADGDPDLVEMIGENDFSISMVWRSSMQDCACVMIVSSAMAKDYGAVISYEGEPPVSLDELLTETKATIEESKRPQRR